MKVTIKGEDFYLYKIKHVLNVNSSTNKTPFTGENLYFISLNPAESIDIFVITKNNVSIMGKKTFSYAIRNEYRRPYIVILEEAVPYIKTMSCIKYSFLALNTIMGGIEDERLMEKTIIESLTIKNTED